MANLFIVSAPSGTGKTSLIKELIKDLDNIITSTSHTTREPRDGEIDGKDYFFVSKKKFTNLIKDNYFLEYATVFDNSYGTSKIFIKENLNKNLDIIIDIDWQGARQVKANYPEAISIFILPPSKKDLEYRLKSRNKDDDEVIIKRMKKATTEMSHFNEYDFIIINDSFDAAVQDFKSIIVANRLSLKQQLKNKPIFDKLGLKNGKISAK